MSGTLDLVLLIDDDPATNFLNRLIVEESGLAAQVEDLLSADAALDYLQQRQSQELSIPQLILVDINMPRISGWDFVERLPALGLDPSPHIAMLTTSTNPADRARAETLDGIAEFLVKPLEVEDFQRLVATLFDAGGADT